MILLAGSSPLTASGYVAEGGVSLVSPRFAVPLAIAGSVSWLALHSGLPVVYGIGRVVGGHDGDAATGVTAIGASELRAWRVSGRLDDPVLTSLGTVVLDGDGPCHAVATDTALYVAYYTGGEVGRLSLDSDGTVIPGSERRVAFTGSGPDPHRQGSSHPHQVLVAASGHVIVTDLGADVVRVLDPQSLETVRETALPPGCGPRHTAELPDGSLAIAGELDETVTMVHGGLVVGRAPSTQESVAARNYPSDIRALAGERVVLANRGVHSLALFAADAMPPRLIVEWPAGGSWPQAIAVSADDAGDRIAVAVRDSDRIAFHLVEDSAVAPLGSADIPRPTTVLDIAPLWDRAVRPIDHEERIEE